MAGQRGPPGRLAEAGRSLEQTRAKSGAERSLRSARLSQHASDTHRYEDDAVECDYECDPIGDNVACATCELNEDVSQYYGRAIWMCAG